MVEPVEQLEIEDSDLAKRAQQGETQAFAMLYERRHGLVFGYFRARVLDGHQAEDLCQEVFLRVFDAIRRYDPNLRFQSWLMGICRNVLREHVRHVKRRRETGWTELCVELEEMFGDDSLYEDVLHLVPVCMAGLSESAAQSLHWHYMGGMRIKQIAVKLDRTLGAVKVLMVRARQALKRCIKKQVDSAAAETAQRGLPAKANKAKPNAPDKPGKDSA